MSTITEKNKLKIEKKIKFSLKENKLSNFVLCIKILAVVGEIILYFKV